MALATVSLASTGAVAQRCPRRRRAVLQRRHRPKSGTMMQLMNVLDTESKLQPWRRFFQQL